MLTVGQTRRDARKPYPTIAGASYDVVGFRSWPVAAAAAERLMYRFNCGFEPIEIGGRFYVVEVVAKYSSVYRDQVHRVKGTTRWAMVRKGAPDVVFGRYQGRIGRQYV